MAPSSAARRAAAVAAQLAPPRPLKAAAAAAGGGPRSAAVPSGFELVPSEEDKEVAGHLRWLQQKDALGQDALLLGPPGALRRHIALRFCELQGREAEVLTVTRDTTEADLKQRRELTTGPAGTQTVYADGAPVRCAILGRILILDGLEKAERNVLPTINNLLENREMSLDDGRFLVAARRFDALPPGTADDAGGPAVGGGSGSRLVRVHENFRVIALALPCPPCVGNPLDPPLRSRFQARVIAPPILAAPAQLGALGPGMPEVLLRRLAALQRALNSLSLGGEAEAEALVAALPPGARPPVLAHDALLRIVRLLSGAGVLPPSLRPTVAEALQRAYPLELLAAASSGLGSSVALREAATQWLKHFQLESEGGSGDWPALSVSFVSAQTAAVSRGEGAVLLDFGAGAAPISLASPALPTPPTVGFVESPALRRLAAAIAQDFAVGHDCLLVGPPGCGKSALARHVAGLLGHGAPGGRGLEFFFLYEEMSSRDLLQRRTTDTQGRTSWVDSPLVRAARSGALCVLDGAHRLRGDVLCALAPLLQDRQALLAAANDLRGAGAEILLRADRYAAIESQLEDAGSYDPASNTRVARIRRDFRVLALAEPPTGRLPWLSDELSTCFSHHVYPEAGPVDLVAILTELFPELPRPSAERLVAALAPEPDVAAAATAGAMPAAGPVVPLRVLVRVARRAAAAGEKAEAAMLAGVLQQALFPFMPRGERAELLARLRKHFDPKDVAMAASQALRSGEWRRQQAMRSETAAPPELAAANAAAGAAGGGGVETVRFGSFAAPRGRPQRPELVPSVDFVDIGRHTELLEELARALFERGERHLLLLGPQGVGKNRVVDHLLQALALEREYMQLHRDTTVAQLTVTPSVADGRLLYEDSPLIRAAQHGRVLVLDEADKAPLEVVVVLKSLVEDGQLALPDGRRLARFAEATEDASSQGPAVVPIHPTFRMLVLANKPGFPFLGNDLIREADVFSVFCLDNPDAASELQLVRAVGPNVPEALLRTLVGIFSDLRLAVEEGRLQYPYSTRELLAVVRHLDKFPDEPLEQALASILAFDRFDPAVRETLRPIFEKRGVPIAAALGAPLDGEESPELQQPWLRALAALRKVRLAATERLRPPVHVGTWRTSAAVDLAVQTYAAEARPAIFDPPQTVQLAALAFDRIQDGFSESVVRARLPISLRSGPIIDAVAAVADDATEGSGGGAAKTLHMLSTMPMAIWTIEDPLAVGAHAGRCAVLPVGPGSDWALLGDRAAGVVTVNGRSVTLGTPQLAWVPGAGALLLHLPLDVLASQLLVERPHREDVRAEVLSVPPLAASRSAGRVRPKVEESFVAVPCASWEPRTDEEAEATEFHAEDTVVFFQPSSKRLVQLDVMRRQVREVSLDNLMADAGRPSHRFLDRLRGGAAPASPSFSITATATLRGVEVLLSEVSPDATGQESGRFFAVLFPEAPGRAPTARRVDAAAAAATAAAPAPAAACAGLFSTPFGTEAPVGLAANAPATGLAHIMEGRRTDDGARKVSALYEREGAAARALRRPPPAAPPSVAELAKADDKTLSKLLMVPGPALPVPRGDCRSTDLAVPGPLGLVTRALEQPDARGDWIEAVHPASRTARRLPARAPADADADVGGGPKAGVARVLAWPLSTEGSSGQAPDSCAVFRDGSVRWLELHPEGLQRSLQEYLEVRGLRSLMEQAKRRTGGGSPGERAEQEEDELDEEEEEEDEEEIEEMEEGEEGEEVEEVEDGKEGDQSQERNGGESGTRRMVLRRGSRRRGRAGGGKQPQRGGGGDGQPQEDGGPERVRRDALRQAKRQRKELLEAQRREEKRRQESRDASGKPKHGDEDDQEHVGGNRWAGGSGGADTAGLGGKGGPYRLEKKGQNVHQISDEAKAQISDEAREAARKMGEEARQKRLKEIEMGGGDYDLYMTILGEVQGEIEQLRRVLGAAAARQRERVWHRGIEGELDENRLVDAIAGEAAVFKRRAEREARPGEVLMQPKRITFLFDTSASMYRFNGMDGRLRRSCETAVMLMEALRGFEQKFDYEICCHDGDHVHLELVPFGHPPEDEKERLKVISKMLASAQYCGSGDNTLPAIERACERVASSGPADDYFVFAFSDANFARYGLTTEALSRTLSRHRSVHAVCFFIATFEDEALSMARQMPDQVKVCLDLKALPAELRQQFVSSVARGGRAAL